MQSPTRLFHGFAAVVAVALCFLPPAMAEDIDLFTSVNPASGGDVPTVLLYVHNKTSTSSSDSHGCTYDDVTDKSSAAAQPKLGNTVTGYEQCAIVNALLAVKNNPLLLGRIKLGIMLFNDSKFSTFDNGSSSAISNGAGQCGFLAYVPKVMDAAEIDKLVTSVKSYDKTGTNDITVSSTAVGDGMASAWAALNGFTDTCGGNNIDYSSIAPSSTDCGSPVIVYIGNATTSTAKAEDATPTGRVDTLLRSQLTNQFGYAVGSQNYNRFTADIPVALIDSQKDKYQADDWARFMNQVNVADSTQADQNIRTYTIGVYNPDQTNIQDQLNYMGSMADAGGGKFFTVSHTAGTALQNILLQIFTEVQAVDSVFSSAALPVSASTQGTFLNQIYIATFRPDRFAGPRWFGNLKQYKFAFDSSGTIVLADQNQPTNNASSATNPNTGGFSDLAHSYWTTNDPNTSVSDEWPSTNGYWENSPAGSAGAHDAPDGDLVEKGGAAQMSRIDYLKVQSTRKVLSCSSATTCGNNSGTLVAFNATNFNEAALGLTAGSGSSNATTATIGSDLGTATLSVTYACSNQRKCKFYLNDASGFPTFYLESGAVPADQVGLASSNITFPLCTVDSLCEVLSVGETDIDGSGVKPFFEIEIKDNAFRNVTNTITLTALKRRSARAAVQQTAHGHSAGDVVTLSDCKADIGGTHFNEQIMVNTSTQGAVETRISNDAYIFAISGNQVAYSTGITCGSSGSVLSAASLINWVRGEDNVGNEALEGPCPLQSDGSRVNSAGLACDFTVRPSIHGDVLHSRPAVINFGDLDNPTNGTEEDVVLFYGANDGMYRAINGNQTRSIGSVRPGGELWSFIAPEFFPALPRLFKDFPRIAYPGIPDGEAKRRDYFFDGNTTFLQDLRSTTDSDTGGKVYIYLTPRRGGKFIYALDVTNPAAPSFLWKKSKTDMAEFGQLWSTPQVATIKGHATTEGHTRPVLIFGAGYDADVEDLDPAGVVDSTTTASTDEGRGVVVLDAKTGALVWAVLNNCSVLSSTDQSKCVSNSGMTYSIAADITLFDNNFDGSIDRLYAADTAANIWRIDIPDSFTGPGDWAVTKFAQLGGAGNNARKFLFPPEVIPSNAYDIVVAVSGDRTKPLFNSSTTTSTAHNVDNRFYFLIDRDSGSSVASTRATLTETALLNRTGFKCYDPASTTVSIVDCSYNATNERYEAGGVEVALVTLTQIEAVGDGYYMTLEGNPGGTAGDSEGEKGVNAPSVIAGKIFFATNQPDTSTGSCSANLGVARGYEIDVFTTEVSTKIYPGGGLPSTATYGLVTIDGETHRFAIGPGETVQSPITPDLNLSGKRKRTYWYYQ